MCKIASLTTVTARYRRRLVDSLLDELLAELPAVLLVGPRASGKTTTALRRAATTLRLDRPATAAAMENDPDAILAGSEPPVLIDEWQLSPTVLGAVKRIVDVEPGPGRFLITGSTRADLQAEGWPATGRVVRTPIWPMTIRETAGRTERTSVIDLLFDGDFDAIRAPQEPVDVRGYVDYALRSGFPEMVEVHSDRARRAWLSSYVDQIVLRDAPFAAQDRDPRRLRAYLRAVAANTASIVSHKRLYDGAGVTRTTALSYDHLLESLFVIDQVPAWSSNRLTRLTRASKRYIIEPGLLGPLLSVDSRTVVRDAGLVGAIVDTFVAAQLRPELTVAATPTSMHHLRQAEGRHEIDLVLEGPAGQLVAIEVKAHAAPTAAMARHLVWLRDALPERFVLGVVFHTGPLPFVLDDRVWALPIATIWA